MKIFIKCFLVIIVLSQITSCHFAPGSYPYAEEYELNYSEDQVKIAIDNFKNDHPEYTVPKVTINNQGSWDLIDEQSEKPNYWYNVYFYYKDENKIVFAWTRPSGRNKTIFAFVSINNGLNIGNWKEINKDFNRSENKEAKKKFKEKILDKIIERL